MSGLIKILASFGFILQAKVQSPTSSTNPFLISPQHQPSQQQPIVDLFSSPTQPTTNGTQVSLLKLIVESVSPKLGPILFILNCFRG